MLVGDAGLVQLLLHLEDGLFGWLEDGIETADYRHGEDDIAVLAAHVDITKNVVCNAPDEVCYPVQISV